MPAVLLLRNASKAFCYYAAFPYLKSMFIARYHRYDECLVNAKSVAI